MIASRLARLALCAFGSALFLNVDFVKSALGQAAVAQDEPPRSLDPRLKIELFAENPQLATPTGIDVDHAGRVWLIESNTHFPPEGYKGHPTDRVLVMEDTDSDGKGRDHKADKITVFKDGLTHTMSIAVKPVWLDLNLIRSGGRKSPEPASDSKEPRDPKSDADSGDSRPPLREDKSLDIFIATRREILLCTDTDGDLKCDETKRLVHLETKGNYPHNGLAGFAFDALGNMFFGFGENLGADYKLIGSDGTTLSGGGEGGNVYRCRPDGSKLERWATGFWNPHASCFDAFGRLFTLDNDPDSRPPCRLLHIIPGGDYGYKFRNGRKGTHPFTSWNGEIPGTLPMVSGTGEAPSGIVCYESDGFPEDYLGTLLVGSWGDHRIDKFVLKPRGASFESLPQPVIKGGENFRPVGLALSPDGSLYVTDWVLKDYKLHGKGRVWRVSAKEEKKPVPQPSHDKLAKSQFGELWKLIEHSHLAVRRSAARVYALREDDYWKNADADKLRDRPVALHEDGFPALKATESLKKLSLRGKYELLLARAALSLKLDDDGPFQLTKDGSAYSDIVDAAYLRLLDPIYGIITSDATDHAAYEMDWMDQLDDLQEPVDPTVWLELARLESLIHGAFVFTCGTGRDHYYTKLPKYLDNPDPFVFSALVEGATREPGVVYRAVERSWDEPTASEGMRLLTVLAARRRSPALQQFVRLGLDDPSPKVRRMAVQWVAEENLTGFRPSVEKVLASEPMTGDLFMACLASLSMLDGVPPAEFEKAPPVQHILPIVKDAQRSASLRAIALRMLPPTLKELDGKLLGTLVASTDEGLRREAVRTLGHSPISERDPLLRGVAADESLDANLRADAVAGLAPVDHHAKLNEATRDLLVKLVSGKDVSLGIEAVRSLRGAAMAKPDQAGSDAKVTAVLKQLATELKIEEPGDLRPPLRDAEEGLRPRLREAFAFALGKRPNSDAARTQYSVLSTDPLATQTTGDNKPIGDAVAGRRVFFHTNSAGCFKCHTVGGRGGQVGPDLTVIARTMDRQKLAESILEPSKEISPQFTTWAVETTSGKVLTGMLLGEEVNGDLRLGDNTGKVFFVPFNEIETRQPLKTSTMPDKLHEQLTRTEFRDLVAYLETLK